MNVKTLSWEGDGLLIIGAVGGERIGYKQDQRASTAQPDILFVGNEAHWQILLDADTFPQEIFVRHKSGGVFKYVSIGSLVLVPSLNS
jgi:hypothetical protein